MSAVKKSEVAVVEQAPVPTTEAAAIFSMIERAARDPNTDVDKMQKLYQMQVEASGRRARTAFLAALSDLQGEMPAVQRLGKGHNDKKYARFEDFIAAVRPLLIKHGFSLTHRVARGEKEITVTAVLGHREGHVETTDLILPADTTGNKNAVQSWASTISYGRRYTGMAILGVASEDEDDDAKAAGAGDTVSDDQAAAIRDKITEVGAQIDGFLKYMKVESISDIPANQFERAMAALSKKARANG
jgi:hypothetical protein